MVTSILRKGANDLSRRRNGGHYTFALLCATADCVKLSFLAWAQTSIALNSFLCLH